MFVQFYFLSQFPQLFVCGRIAGCRQSEQGNFEIPLAVFLEDLNRLSVEKHVDRQFDIHSGFQTFEDQPPFPVDELEVILLEPGDV